MSENPSVVEQRTRIVKQRAVATRALPHIGPYPQLSRLLLLLLIDKPLDVPFEHIKCHGTLA